MNSQVASPLLAGRSKAAWVLFLAVVLVTLAADLIVKWQAFQQVAGVPVLLSRDMDPHTVIPMHPTITIVPKLLSLKLVLNTGAVFGLGKGSQWLFVIVSLAAVGVIGRVFWKSPAGARAAQVALALILAGALGNLYDRVRFNAVRDMFWLFPEVHLPFGWTWPGGRTDLYPWIFNVADVALLAGVGIMLLVLWRSPRPSREAQKAPG